MKRLSFGFVVLLILSAHILASGLPVRTDRPRVFFTPSLLTQLRARVQTNDPRWLRLKAKADELKTLAIFPFKTSTRGSEPENTIFYDYQGEGWFNAALPLGLAYVMTGDKAYSGKLLELADEMIRAESDPENMPPNGQSPLAPGNYYASRNNCPVMAIIYDWCYDELGASRKTAMRQLMNVYFDSVRTVAYQRNTNADGNYYTGHMIGVGYMGYALAGDDARAQMMIDYARIRFDGSPSSLLGPDDKPEENWTQLFEGGYLSQMSRQYNSEYITGAPFKGGFDFQGWAYGAFTFNSTIDYCQIVRSATSEDLLSTHRDWLSQILRSLKHHLMPNRFEIFPSGDWGSDYGAVISASLPLRLAFFLAGSADGPGAQHFLRSEIAEHSPYPEYRDDIYQEIGKPAAWEDFFYGDTTRPSSELVQPPYYSGFAPVYPKAKPGNGAIPYFFMRSDWGSQATWASIHMGAAYYDDHQHNDAGHIWIKRANDYLLIDAANWKGALGSIGIVGSSMDEEYSASAVTNTLYFNDWGEQQYTDMPFTGGQGFAGKDEVTADEQTMQYSYVRGDLSTAYATSADTTLTANRRLDYFYRSFFYQRFANVFVVFDQVKAKPSANPKGPYPKHMRWHFPVKPVINQNAVLVEKGDSRLHMISLMPTALSAVDEGTNPDPCEDATPPCTPWGENSGTWRLEVRDANNPLTQQFLMVMQSVAKDQAAPTASVVNTTSGNMTGVLLTTASNDRSVVLFNSQEAQVPTPIDQCSYSIPAAATAAHSLCGMEPGARYNVAISGDNVSVSSSTSGSYTASEAGVLRFGTLPTVEVESNSDLDALNTLYCYPNPSNTELHIRFRAQAGITYTLELFDAVGQRCSVREFSAGESGMLETQLSLSSIREGCYLCQIRSAAGVVLKPVIVVH